MSDLHSALKRIEELEALINSPEINNFLEGLKIEAAHQTEKWGPQLDNWPHDFSLVLDKLKGKQALSIWDLDVEKYKHHLITMAAVCFNAHSKLSNPMSNMYQHFYKPDPATTLHIKLGEKLYPIIEDNSTMQFTLVVPEEESKPLKDWVAEYTQGGMLPKNYKRTMECWFGDKFILVAGCWITKYSQNPCNGPIQFVIHYDQPRFSLINNFVK